MPPREPSTPAMGDCTPYPLRQMGSIVLVCLAPRQRNDIDANGAAARPPRDNRVANHGPDVSGRSPAKRPSSVHMCQPAGRCRDHVSPGERLANDPVASPSARLLASSCALGTSRLCCGGFIARGAAAVQPELAPS